MRRVAVETTAFQKLEVWEGNGGCEFRVEGAVHAWWHEDRYLTGLAWDNIAAGVLMRGAGPPASLVMLGLAGGTSLRVLRKLLPDCRMVAVDIDPQVVELARRYMRLDEIGVEVEIADAYEWARSHGERYDAVVDDCYLAGKDDVFRPQRDVERGLRTLRRLTAPGGVYLTNLITGAGHRRVQSKMRAAFKRAFAEVRSVATPESWNETLVGGDRVATGGVLGPWTAAFVTAKDRELWRRLRVRALKVRAES